MKQEIERKFLVKERNLPALPKGKDLVAGYFCENPEIRVRVEGDKSFLTIKSKGLIARDEFEYEICIRDAKKLLELTSLKIEKNRCTLNIDGFIWQIDHYKGENKGLVIAEIELPNPNIKFRKPLWVDKEVTFDLKYRNISLAEHPFSKLRS